MADDLDDFFNEIEEVEQEAVQEGGEASEPEPHEEQPPAKRSKTETGSSSAAAVPAPVRPRGLVVAAASSAVIRKPAAEPTEDTENVVSANHATATTSTTVGIGSSTHQALSTPSISSSEPAPPPPPPPPPNSNTNGPKKPLKRMAAGKVWVDPTLDEWPENDFRIFVGNLDRGVTDSQLYSHYTKYASIAKAKIVTDPKGVSKGYGFVSFLEPLDCAKAIRETDQTWLGSRPIRVKRSDWRDRNLNQVMKNNKKQQKQRKRMGI